MTEMKGEKGSETKEIGQSTIKTSDDKSLKAMKEHWQSRHRLEIGVKEHLKKRPLLFSLSVRSDREREPTREGVRAAVLRLRRSHAGDDTLGTSQVFWVKT